MTSCRHRVAVFVPIALLKIVVFQILGAYCSWGYWNSEQVIDSKKHGSTIIFDLHKVIQVLIVPNLHSSFVIQ